MVITYHVHIQTRDFINLMKWTYKRPKCKLELRIYSFTVSCGSPVQIIQCMDTRFSPLPSPRGKPNCNQEVGSEPKTVSI